MPWEPLHSGAQTVATGLGYRLYFNAPSREDDVDRQIALVEQVVASRYQGLVLAPEQSLALMTPVRRALGSGMLTVVVSTPLSIPPDRNLFYVLNDEREGCRLAADRIAQLTGGKGTIAILGIRGDAAGVVVRAALLEQLLTAQLPGIDIVERRAGTSNVAHEQQGAEEVLREHPGLQVLIALTSVSTHAAISAAEESSATRAVRVIGFDPDSLPFENPALDSLVVPDVEGMGEQAIRVIAARRKGRPMPERVELKPVLVTRDNMNSPRVRELLLMDWRPGSLHRIESGGR